MLRQLNFRSFFNFLGRNKLYAFINIFGLSVSLMFVILIADYTVRQLTVDNIHTKQNRIFVVGSERDISSGYYLQKFLLDRYPEIESTCAVTKSGWSTDETESLQIGTQKFAATALYADTTFFKMFDFPLVAGNRDEALASRNNIVLSESFARKAFGTFNPLGQVVHIGTDSLGNPREFVVSAVMKDINNSSIPDEDILLRAERLCELNGANNEYMNNAGAVVTFVLQHEGSDLQAKIPDILSYFKEIYWTYRGNVSTEVILTPLPNLYFSGSDSFGLLNQGSKSFVIILIVVGLIILVFAIMNYINLTVAQTGFRAKEMATRRLVGSSRGEIILKLMLESTVMCATAFAIAVCLAITVEPYVAQLLENKIDVIGDFSGMTGAAYACLIILLGIVAGFIPALIISRFKPIDVMNGSFRRKTKMVYSSVLISLQNVITIVLIASSLTISLQIRHLINTPLGYDSHDVLDISTQIFDSYDDIRNFREKLRSEPCVEIVAMGCSTPLSGGNNNTLQYGPDRMISFSSIICDSAYFRMFGLEVLHDNHMDDAWMINEYALKELGITADTTNVKMGTGDYTWDLPIGGVIRNFQFRSAIDKPSSGLIQNIGDFDRFMSPEGFTGEYPWNILVRTRGDRTEAYNKVKAVYDASHDDGFFRGEYMDQQIVQDYAEQQRLSNIVFVFTVVAVIISALGLLAMSTYYIQQKEQEVAIRKVFGSTHGEILRRLIGPFMRLVGISFVIAVPISWYAMTRWLEDYSVRIPLSPIIFISAGAFAAAVAFVTVYWQSRRAAGTNPIDSVKNK